MSCPDTRMWAIAEVFVIRETVVAGSFFTHTDGFQPRVKSSQLFRLVVGDELCFA
jgi:hypothetical protein